MLVLVLVRTTGSSGAAGGSTAAAASVTKITAIGAENEYADVISQVGGKYVNVSSIMSNPNTDPHTFEASPAVAREITAAKLIVQNGVGYDDWMTTIENADPNGSRKVINVQQLLGLPDSTPNPHLWYKPTTMPAVASAIATDLGQIDPAHAAYFKANAASFTAQPERMEQRHRGVQVSAPEHPGRDHGAGRRLHAPGRRHRQPDAFHVPGRHHERHRPLAAEHGAPELPVHPAQGEGVPLQPAGHRLPHRVVHHLAQQNGIPVVGVYETMPTPGYTYQTWMEAEVNALNKAVTDSLDANTCEPGQMGTVQAGQDLLRLDGDRRQARRP